LALASARPYPGWHEQLPTLVLNGGEVAPSGQARHASVSLAPENMPLAHGRHALIALARPCPGRQTHRAPDARSSSFAPAHEQLLALVLSGGDVAPSGQGRHALLPSAPENVPLAHGRHALVALARPCPGRHTHRAPDAFHSSFTPAHVQLSALVLPAGEAKPAAQGVQSSVLGPVSYVCMGHSVQGAPGLARPEPGTQTHAWDWASRVSFWLAQ
jgi:hypothetical protein